MKVLVIARDTVLEHRGLRLDPAGRKLHFKGEPVELTARELALLTIFMQNPGRIPVEHGGAT